MNDILARRARRATVGIALSAALVAGIAPATAIAAEISAPTGTVALQSEDAAAEKDKAYAAMQKALANLEVAKATASPKIIAGINNMIASDQELHDIMLAHAADDKELLPTMQANFDAAQAEYDKANNRVSELYAEFDKAMRNMASDETIRQLREAIIEAETQKEICESTLDHRRDRLESQKYWIGIYENRAEGYKASANERIAKRDALLDNLKKSANGL